MLQLAACDWSVGDGDGSGAHVGAAIQSGPSGRGGTNTRNSADRKRFQRLSRLASPSPRQVFKKAYIPRTLTEVSHYERDVDLMRAKEEESAISGHDDNVRTITCGL